MEHFFEWLFGVMISAIFGLVGIVYKIQAAQIKGKASREHCDDLHRVVDRRLEEIGKRFDKVDGKQDEQLKALAEIQGTLNTIGVIKEKE